MDIQVTSLDGKDAGSLTLKDEISVSIRVPICAPHGAPTRASRPWPHA